jgi:hypothetical protein
MAPRRHDALALLALATAATVYLWPVVGGGQCLAGGDLVNSYLPYRHVVNRALSAGDWPWWNPWTFCGQPLVANLNAALFYPPNLVSIWIPLPRWFGWTVWLHVIWGLAGSHLFHRRAGLGPPAALVGAVIFWASGFFIFNLQSGIVLFHQAGAWWPWAMLAALAWMQTGHRPWIAMAAVCLAMMFLAGAPQILFYAAGTMTLMTLMLALGHPHWRSRLAGLAVIIALAALLVQVQFLPAREAGLLSQRAQWSPDEAWELHTGDSLMPRSLILALVPTLCGEPTDHEAYWGTVQGHHEVVPAVMTPPLVLALLGLLAWRASSRRRERDAASPSSCGMPAHGRWVAFHLALGLLALATAFGRHSPIFRLLWLSVPGFQEFRVPARISLVALWCLACLSAVMFERLWAAARRPVLSDGNPRRAWAIGGWAVAGTGVVLSAALAALDTHSLLLAFDMPPGSETMIPGFISSDQFLASHLLNAPHLIYTAKEALLRWGVAVTLTGLGVALWCTWPRIWHSHRAPSGNDGDPLHRPV